jgi:hypothetical protein
VIARAEQETMMKRRALVVVLGLSPLAACQPSPPVTVRDAPPTIAAAERPSDAAPATIPDAAATSVQSPPPAPIDAGTPRPRPSVEMCDQHAFVPQCLQAFPEEARCPERFADIEVGALCGLAGRTKTPPRCAYPEAVCKCAQVSYCGGAAPTYLQQAGMRWQCAPPRAPDDCPESAANGAACKKNGQECSYGTCTTSTQCKCAHGKYTCTTRHFAPPPSAAPHGAGNDPSFPGPPGPPGP